jgi:hypothetical protein
MVTFLMSHFRGYAVRYRNSRPSGRSIWLRLHRCITVETGLLQTTATHRLASQHFGRTISWRTSDGTRGTGKTIALEVSGPQSVVTADTAGASAVDIHIDGVKCATLGGAHVTDHAVAGCGRLTVGSKVVLDLTISGSARLNTIGFAK